MPYNFLNLQLFGEEGSTDTGVVTGTAENVSADGVATESATEQIATASDESWDSLIKGKYKEDYNRAVNNAINKRFKNQRDLQSQIDSINPMVQALAQKYGIAPDAQGRIDINALNQRFMDDNSLYEDEAFKRGMSVDDLKQMKALERENAQLKAASNRANADREWQQIVEQGNRVREMYPDFNMEAEMQNPQFAQLLKTFQNSGFPDAVRTAYESIHRDEIMGGAMRYGVQKAQEKLTNSVQANLSRPRENGLDNQSTAHVGEVDPSKLTRSQIDDIKRRAQRGERITFA